MTFSSTFAGTSGAKDLVSQEQLGSGSQAQPYLALTAVTKSPSESSAASRPDQSPAPAPKLSPSQDQTLKRGEYPHRSGENKIDLTEYCCVLRYYFADLFHLLLDISEHKPHLALPVISKPNTDSPSSVQAPSLSASQDPAVKPGEYPFKRGEISRFQFVLLLACFFILLNYNLFFSTRSQDTQSQSKEKCELSSVCR